RRGRASAPRATGRTPPSWRQSWSTRETPGPRRDERTAVGACAAPRATARRRRSAIRALGGTVQRPPCADAWEVRKDSRLDPVTVRMHRPWLKAEPGDDGGRAVVAVVGVPHQRREELAVRRLDTTEHALTPVRVEGTEVAGGRHRRQSTGEQPAELGR